MASRFKQVTINLLGFAVLMQLEGGEKTYYGRRKALMVAIERILLLYVVQIAWIMNV